MGNVCNQVCTCCENNKQISRLQRRPQPLKVAKVSIDPEPIVLKQPHPSKYKLEQPTDTFEVVTGQQYGDGPHPSIAKISHMPKLTKEQMMVLQRQLPLKEENVRGSKLNCFFLPNKRIWYEGQWIKGLPNGRGKAFFETSVYFEGYFKDGYANCNDGLLVFPQGSYYRGQIKDSKLCGKGVYFNAYNRNQYKGDFENDKPHGFGVEEFTNGNRYEGQFKDGYKSGQGRFTWANGMTYDGDFKLGYMWGLGKLQKGKAVYKGQFEKGRKVGKAVQIKTETGVYQGPLDDGMMSGSGKFMWDDNKQYRGDFQKGQLHGQGVIEYPNGQRVKGTWQKGVNTGIDQLRGK